jgi:hypothetical protein
MATMTMTLSIVMMMMMVMQVQVQPQALQGHLLLTAATTTTNRGTCRWHHRWMCEAASKFM